MMPDPGGPTPAVPARMSVPATRAAISARTIRLFIVKLLGLCRSTTTAATIVHAVDLPWTFRGHLLTLFKPRSRNENQGAERGRPDCLRRETARSSAIVA